MKKQRKQIIIMAVFLGFLIVSYFGLGAYNDAQSKEEDENQKEPITVIDLDYNNVVAFSYNFEEESNSFTQKDDIWSYDADAAFDVDESMVATMLEDACELMAQDYYDAYESLDNYGLDAPQKTITMSFADGSVVKLKLGNYNDIVGYYYLMVEGDSNLYLVDSTLFDSFDVSYTDLEVVVEETETTSEETEQE